VRQLPPRLSAVDAAGQFVEAHDGRSDENHFGDDASVDPAVAAKITNYLVSNAGDTGGQRYSDKLLRGVSTTKAPLRITELERWVKEHREVPAWEWKHKEVRSKANCLACHAGAERGYYDDCRAAPVAERQWLSIGQVHQKLEAAGFRNVEKIEREHGVYEARATDRNGERVKLYIHPQTGEVTERSARAEHRKRDPGRCHQRQPSGICCKFG
jgi:hypothetical protein